jgi:uncharacterized membrane protein YjgN (DUF898 family)
MTDSTADSTAAPPPDGTTARAAHHGRLDDALALALLVLLLRVVTLGLYHFWGRTRIRRYLWSHTAWDGERLVYTGTGRELMLGYARAFFLVILPIYVAFSVLGWLGDRHPWLGALGGVVGAPLFVYLSGVAQYASWRYRLSRTVWRGIRFGLEGSHWRFGGYYLRQVLLAVVTGGLYVPQMQCRIAGRAVSAARFGTERFAYDGRGRDLMPAYLRTVAFTAVIGLIGILGVAALTPYLMWFGNQPGGVILRRLPWLFVVPPLGFVAGAAALAAVWIAYRGARLRYHVAHTQLGPLRFRLDFRWPEYVRLMLGNLGLATLTLGVALPVTAVRTARFLAGRLTCSGTLDTAAIAQSLQALGSTGEGLFQALDLGEF